METKSFNLYRYSIPVDSQLILRGRFLKRREGLIVRVACSRDGWGEIAPLPGFSEETIEQAQEQAIEWLTNWCHASCEAPRDVYKRQSLQKYRLYRVLYLDQLSNQALLRNRIISLELYRCI